MHIIYFFKKLPQYITLKIDYIPNMLQISVWYLPESLAEFK